MPEVSRLFALRRIRPTVDLKNENGNLLAHVWPAGQNLLANGVSAGQTHLRLAYL